MKFLVRKNGIVLYLTSIHLDPWNISCLIRNVQSIGKQESSAIRYESI